MESDGQVHRLHIHDVTVQDAGIYKAVLGDAQSIMALKIKGKRIKRIDKQMLRI